MRRESGVGQTSSAVSRYKVCLTVWNTRMLPRTRSNEYLKIAKDFLRRAEIAPTMEEREDFLDMARAIERAHAKEAATGQEYHPEVLSKN
jgi:hypothetical protein